ncbi:glycoside hydrolase family 101 beta sandwich domain-containing protein [Tessaracoccus massiliensis]|uniref:glycoside hydrolase family 101 beta sandwich domain-containing protein n=1 Tax=Tessaracoccus massiliensis TaxID=1522311 RepID=UPI00058FA8EE|nr:glycoside hydrolase family 101 beta sandwich domain-containing protein [Tessaracoccus massiliensis]
MVSKKTRIASVVAASALAAGGIVIPNYVAHGDPAVVIPAGAIELQDYDFKVRLHPDFPQVVDYRLGDEQLAGRIGGPLTSMLVNGQSQTVTVAEAVVGHGQKSATYAVSFPNLAGVTLTVLAEVEDRVLRLTLTDLVDPESRIQSIQIPNHDLVTLGSTDAAAQLTTARVAAGTQAGGDTFQKLAGSTAGSAQGSSLVLANTSSLAAAFATNAVGTAANGTWQHQIRTSGHNRLGAVSAGTWTGVAGAEPYVEVKVVADENGDGTVDWQDAGVAAQSIIALGNGAEEVANEVIARAPSGSFAQAQADTAAISAATENLGQRVVLEGVTADADGLEAMSDAGVALNSTFGYDVAVAGATAGAFQSLWDNGPVNVDTLYFDQALDTPAQQQLNAALQEQGWVVSTHPLANTGADSDVIRFVYNAARDGWNDDPILGAAQFVDFGDDAFYTNVWENNLPAKFLQRSDLTDRDATTAKFANGTVATATEVTYGDVTVAKDGAYLLPWCDGGSEWNDEGPKRLYHYNPAGGATTWTLTEEFAADTSFTQFSLTDQGRALVREVKAASGAITIQALPGTAYVLFPTSEAPTAGNLPPAEFTVEDAAAKVGTPVSIQVQTTDPEEGELTYSATGLHAGLAINAGTGAITGTPTKAGTYHVTVTAKDAAGASASATLTITVAPKDSTTPPTTPPPTTPPATTQPPSTPPATKPAVEKFVPQAPYTLPGLHKGLNGRDWMTKCEPYSQTERCRTDIWATVVLIENGQFVRKSGWAFNNLTYLPYMTEASWKGNPLGDLGATTNGLFDSAGRQWRTECKTPATGGDACRSYTMTTVYAATPKAEGGYTFSQKNEWVFNNIVMFGGPEKR